MFLMLALKKKWRDSAAQENLPRRSVVLSGAPRGVVYLNKSLKLFGSKAPIARYPSSRPSEKVGED